MYQHEANKLGNRISSYEHNLLIGLKTKMEKAGETENKTLPWPTVVRNETPAPTGMPAQKVKLEKQKKKMKKNKKRTKWGKKTSSLIPQGIDEMTRQAISDPFPMRTGVNGEPAVNGYKGTDAQMANGDVVVQKTMPWNLFFGIVIAVLLFMAWRQQQSS